MKILTAIRSLLVWQSRLPESIESSGCSRSHKPGYYHPPGIPSGNLTRNYSIQVPPGYAEGGPWPLIFDFHGATQNPDKQHENSLYYKYPAGNDYLVVYPAGVDHSWQGAPYAAEGVNDLKFVVDLLQHLTEFYCIDPERVYASGKSNGGGFVDTLACSDQGDHFAAFAMASAALYTEMFPKPCGNKDRALLESHGRKDHVINFNGKFNGTKQLTPDIDTWIHTWGLRDQCDETYVRYQPGYRVTSFSCNGTADVLQQYRINELGHCWPSSSGDNFDYLHRSDCNDFSLDFTPLVLDFFANRTLSKAKDI